MKTGERITWRSVNKDYQGTIEKELNSVILVRMDNGKQMIIDKSTIGYERQRQSQ